MVQMEFMGIDFSCVYGSLSDGKFPEKDCLLPLISKLLGYAIVAASTTVKLPQIMKIVQHKSVRGLSVVAFEMEVIGYTIALAYCLHKGLPFSAYGELAFLLIQAIILVATIYYFSQPVGNSTWIRALLYCGLAPTILAGKIDPLLFEALYASQHAIFFFARVPQIYENFKNKSTGELSFLTSFMNSAGSIVRVFTSLQEKAPTSELRKSLDSSVVDASHETTIVENKYNKNHTILEHGTSHQDLREKCLLLRHRAIKEQLNVFVPVRYEQNVADLGFLSDRKQNIHL